MGQEYVGVCIICSVRSGQEVLRLTCGSKLTFVGGCFGFMLVVMFQGLLHHLFVELVKPVSSVIVREGAYAIEFSVGSHRSALNVGFWEGKRFVCMPMLHCGRDVPPTKSYINLVSRLLSAISGDATIICCGGSNADFVKVLDKSPGRKSGVQYPFALAPVQIERLLHKPSFSVMGELTCVPCVLFYCVPKDPLMNAGCSQHSISEWYLLVIFPCGCPSSTAAE